MRTVVDRGFGPVSHLDKLPEIFAAQLTWQGVAA